MGATLAPFPRSRVAVNTERKPATLLMTGRLGGFGACTVFWRRLW